MSERRDGSSGYRTSLEGVWYGLSHPFYDLMTWWCFPPLGGERACRARFLDWIGARPGERVLSLCCGTGTTELALAAAVRDLAIVAIDLGAGQIATARRKDRARRIDFRTGDASRTGLPAASFDRVVIVLALHEMPRELRLRVLREAARACKRGGRVTAIEHARPRSLLSRVARHLCWFTWLPGNPERETTADLQRRGLAAEMGEAGLEVLERRTTRPDWIEGVTGRPRD